MSIFDLTRFKRAQERNPGGFSTALSELEAGQKRSHWIWYIFPQLAGLGHSEMAVAYGLHGVAEAIAYLRDPELRQRLLVLTDIVIAQLKREPALTLVQLMGSEIDALKLVSCMTLFREVARRLNAREPLSDYAALADRANAILALAAAEGFDECQPTLRQLAASPLAG